jgi:hypothetical protein
MLADPLGQLRGELLDLLTRELNLGTDVGTLGIGGPGSPLARQELIRSWRGAYSAHRSGGLELPDYLDLADRLERGPWKPFLSRVLLIAKRADDEPLCKAVEGCARMLGFDVW